MAAPKQAAREPRRRDRKSIPVGQAHIKSTFNNTIISITDPSGAVVSWASGGDVGFKGSRKSTPYAAGMAAESAARKAMEFVRYATGLRREEARLSQLTIGLKCGESDTTSGFASNPAVGVVTERLTSSGATIMFGETPELTGAEQVLVNSFEKDELRTEFMKVYKSYFDFILSQGVDLLGSQPNKGNIAGGISTIEEKAMGNIQKIGHAKIHGILDTAEVPREPGLYFMNTSSAAADLLTAMAAAGAAVQLFTTGKGNNVGTAISPVIKICANRETCENSAENIDVDISGIIYGGSSLSSGADAIMECMARVCSGEYTSTEMLFHEEFAPTRLFPQS